MKIPSEFVNIPLRDYSEQTIRGVKECREIIGYQDGLDWECPKFTHGDEYVWAKYPSQKTDVAGFNCLPCLVMEMKRQQVQGEPFPITPDCTQTKDCNLPTESQF